MVDARRRRVHERFLQILRRERAHHAAHVAFIKKLPLRPLEGDAEWLKKLWRRLESRES